jgi:hypothetical protein
LPIKSRIKYKLCLQMHLIHTNQRPDYMAEMVQLTAANSSRHGLRSASHLLYQTPALKTKFGEQAFSHAGPVAWNSLPNFIRSESNTNNFKKLLETYFFKSLF